MFRGARGTAEVPDAEHARYVEIRPLVPHVVTACVNATVPLIFLRVNRRQVVVLKTPLRGKIIYLSLIVNIQSQYALFQGRQ